MSFGRSFQKYFALAGLVGINWVGVAVAAADMPAPCLALSGKSLILEDETPIAIAAARVLPATDTLPEHCVINGFVAPQVGFEFRLPTSAWNGRYLQQGCRGLCGFIPSDTTNDALARGYAVGTTDMGHKAASSQSAIWARGNSAAKLDFGHRATHVTATAAAEIVRRIYGRPPAKRVFRGCGTGGRQGLVEAQRYPEDFDGVIVNGGIVFDFTKLNYLMVHSVRSNRDANGGPILRSADLQLLHDAVMKKCDALDGLSDQKIESPQRCPFDPKSLLCSRGNERQCLTAEQVDAARKMYRGPRTSKGEQIYPGMAFGSELRWDAAFFGEEPRYGKFTSEIFRYFLSDGIAAGEFHLATFDLDTPLTDFRESESLVGADSTDYRAFRSRGGKILAIHGWNESAMPGAYATAYYDRLTRDTRSRDAAMEFFRLYMVSGDMHCTSGIPEGRHFDVLTIMERWMEEGQPPSVITGYEVNVEPKLPAQVRFPIGPENIRSERPFVPYPSELRLRRGADPTTIESYVVE